MTEQSDVQARVLKQVRVLSTTKPEVVVLALNTGSQTEHLAVPRSELDKIGDLLKKNAANPKAADGTAPSDVA